MSQSSGSAHGNAVENLTGIFHRDLQSRAPQAVPVKRYRLDKVIGEGTYGLVHKGLDKKTNKKIAVKQMDSDPDDQGLPSVALREICFLVEMEHQNLISLLDLVVGERHLMLIFEFLDMDLREYQNEYIARYKRFSSTMVRSYSYQILSGLDYIHSRKVIHRDMKPQNVLIDIQHQLVKIADFGLARIQTSPLRQMTNEVVTLWYRAPELLLGSDIYTTSVDIWSMGVIIIELIENESPFQPDCEIRGLHQIFMAFGTPTASQWGDCENQKHYNNSFPKWDPKPWTEITPHATPDMIDLLKKMFSYDPSKRITCRAALQHTLFQPDADFDPAELDNKEPNTPTGSSIHPRNMPKVERASYQKPPRNRLVRRIQNYERNVRKEDIRKMQQLLVSPTQATGLGAASHPEMEHIQVSQWYMSQSEASTSSQSPSGSFPMRRYSSNDSGYTEMSISPIPGHLDDQRSQGSDYGRASVIDEIDRIGLKSVDIPHVPALVCKPKVQRTRQETDEYISMLRRIKLMAPPVGMGSSMAGS